MGCSLRQLPLDTWWSLTSIRTCAAFVPSTQPCLFLLLWHRLWAGCCTASPRCCLLCWTAMRRLRAGGSSQGWHDLNPAAHGGVCPTALPGSQPLLHLQLLVLPQRHCNVHEVHGVFELHAVFPPTLQAVGPLGHPGQRARHSRDVCACHGRSGTVSDAAHAEGERPCAERTRQMGCGQAALHAHMHLSTASTDGALLRFPVHPSHPLQGAAAPRCRDHLLAALC